jgi:hypothetical protein
LIHLILNMLACSGRANSLSTLNYNLVIVKVLGYAKSRGPIVLHFIKILYFHIHLNQRLHWHNPQ